MKKQALAILLGLSILCVGCGKINNDGQGTSDVQGSSAKKEITTVKLTADQGYDDSKHAISFLGLKEYDEIKGEKLTDTPEKGKKFLVLFLEVHIKSEEEGYKFYFHPDYLKAKADGKQVENTYLLNDPFEYDTVFKNYEFGQDAGYIVYQVPEDWEKLTLTYTGLEQIVGNKIKMEFTRKDLKDPEEKWKVIPEQIEYRNLFKVF